MRHRTAGFYVPFVVVAASACLAMQAHAQELGCRTGANALADAYVLLNPIYSHIFGDLESYVAENREHFREGGDAIRCATALSSAVLGASLQLYDPSDRVRRDELNAQLGAMGISPGQQESTSSTELYGVSMRLSRLARSLPAAANGDYEPLWTPTNELEQLQIAAEQMLRVLLPQMADVMAQIEPQIRELAALEHRSIREAAERLTGSR